MVEIPVFQVNVTKMKNEIERKADEEEEVVWMIYM